MTPNERRRFGGAMEIRHIEDVCEFAAEKMRKHNLFQTERFFLDVYCLRPGQSQKPHAHAAAAAGPGAAGLPVGGLVVHT